MCFRCSSRHCRAAASSPSPTAFRAQYRAVRGRAAFCRPGADDLGRPRLLHLVSIYNLFVVSIFAAQCRSVQPEQGNACRFIPRRDNRRDRRRGGDASLARYVSPMILLWARPSCSNSRVRGRAPVASLDHLHRQPRPQPPTRTAIGAASSRHHARLWLRYSSMSACFCCCFAITSTSCTSSSRHRQPELHRPRRADRVFATVDLLVNISLWRSNLDLLSVTRSGACDSRIESD